MSEPIQVRKIPKKHIVAIILTIIVGIGYYLVSTKLKEEKLREILVTLGHPNITHITVFKTHSVEDVEVKRKGTLYSLEFKDLDQQKMCRGFVLYNYKHEYSKDVECK